MRYQYAALLTRCSREVKSDVCFSVECHLELRYWHDVSIDAISIMQGRRQFCTLITFPYPFAANLSSSHLC